MTHHPECEDATGEYPGSCTCAIIKRREAMDDLIAQDADLIDVEEKTMTEITQADRDAAAEAFYCEPLRRETYNDDWRVQAFARHRQQAIEALRLAVVHYDAALKISWPYGASGDAWEHWNEARITLQEAGEAFTRPDNV